MTKNNLLKFSLINLIVGLVVLSITYFMFHFITDSGISLTWRSEACKPFVTNMVAHLGVLFIFASAICFIASLVFFDNAETKDK